MSAWLLLAVSVIGGSTGRVRAQTVPRQVHSTQSAPHSEMLHLEASDAKVRPLAMVKGDFDEDGTPDLVIGYSAANGGTLQLLHGNPEALAPGTQANWLAAAHHETIKPFLEQLSPVSVKTEPELLLAADVNGDGHLDLVSGSRNGNVLHVLLGNGQGGFQAKPLDLTLPGSVTALAAWRTGAPVSGEALLVGYTTDHASVMGIFSCGSNGLTLNSTYALPAAATAITVTNLDADSIPDAAILAGGELLVLHGKNALTGGGRLEALPVDGAESLAVGEFLFDRHAQMQLAVATGNGNIVILAHQGFDPTPWTTAEIAATRRRQKGQNSRMQQAGNTGDAPWIEIENHDGVLTHPEGTLLVRSRISGAGADDVIAVSPGTSERTVLRHINSATQVPSRANVQPHAAISRFSGAGSGGNAVAALSMHLSPDANEGLVVLNDFESSLEITLPSAGNTFFVNTTADNTGITTDPSDGIRCTEGSGEVCTLRDAITFVNSDASDNITAGRSDTIMVPAGTYVLTWQAGLVDGNTNALTHLEVLGPVSLIGSTSDGGTIINANNNDTVFTINPGPFGSFNPSGESYLFDMTMENLVIENGKNTNNLNSNDLANFVGGGMNWDAFGAGNLTLTNTTVKNNTVMWGPGGGIWTQNSASGGTGTLTISGGSISNNLTAEQGGGLYNASPPAAWSLSNTTITGNEASISINPSDGDADGAGGGMYLEGRLPPAATPRTTLSNVTVSSNTAANDNGGGINTFSGILVSNSIVSNNSTGGSGGGIWSNPAGDGSQTTITSSNILTNAATGTGGGMALGIESQAAGNILQVSLSRIVGNSAAGGASGLANGVSGEGAGEAIATENWWGCNTGPTAAGDGCDQAILLSGAGSLTAAPYAKLALTSNITTIPAGGSMDLTVTMNSDSNNNPIPGAFPAVATNFPYTFNVSGVTASPALTTGTFNASGTGTATLTPTSSGSGSVMVTFDNQTEELSFTAQAGTATSVTITAIPSTDFFYGQPSGFTAQLTPSNATGVSASNFQVLIDGVGTLGGNPFGLTLIGNNSYQIFGPFNRLSPGGHTLTVNFLGTADFLARTQSLPLAVNAGIVSVSSVISPLNPIQGRGGTVTVTVSAIGSGLAPTGSISYAYDSEAGNSAPLAGGTASIPVPASLSAGNHSLSLAYGGDGNYAAATASTLLTIQPPPNYVVTTTADDAGEASNCTIQSSTTTGTDSNCSLRDALLAAANAGTASNIYFDSTRVFLAANTPAQNTITVTGNSLTIPSNTAIIGATTGSGAQLANLVTVSGGGSSSNFSIFTVANGVSGAAIANLVIANGYINSQGGAIDTAGSLSVSGCTFANNYAGGNQTGGGNGGGAIFVDSGALTISNSTFTNNVSSPGGAIALFSGALTIRQSTFTGNSTQDGKAGSAIFVNSGTLAISNSTVSGNSAPGNGYAIFSNATLSLANTIVAGNSGGDCPTSGATPCSANGTNGNLIGVSSINLAPLGNYGGPTQTMIPLPGSPAICAALVAQISSGITTDQRGETNTNAGYPGYSSGAACVDAGAVQTNYGLSFSAQPVNIAAGEAMIPAPAVTLSESGTAFADGKDAISIPLTLTGNGTLSGGTASTDDSLTSPTKGVASYAGLTVNAMGSDDKLTATLSLNPNLTTPLSLTAPSNLFNVGTALTATVEVSSAFLTVSFPITAFTPVTGSGGSGTLTYSISPGLPAGLNFSSTTGAISGTPAIALSATTYTVTVTDQSSATASQTFVLEVNGPLKATQAIATKSLTVNITSPAFTPVAGSGGTGTLTYSISPVLPGGLNFSTATGAISGTPTAISSATSYTVTVTDQNSATATASFALTVNGAVSAAQTTPTESLTYGAAASFTPVTGSGGTGPLTYSISSALPAGLSFNSSTGVVSGTPAATSPARTYTVTVTDQNNATANAGFTLTVSAALLTVSINTQSRPYGTANPAFSGTVTGLVNGDSATSIGLVYATPATMGSAVGKYPITASITDANYTLNAAPSTLTVSAATLTVTVNSQSRAYGTVNPTFSGTVTGLVNGDTAVSVGLAFATTATTSSAAGMYPITASITNANYTLNAIPGTLTITGVPLAVTANNATRFYGAGNPAFSGTVTGAVNGDTFVESYTTAATQISNAGTYAIVPSVTGTGLSDYTVQTTNGSLTIAQAASATSLSASASSLTYGQNLTLTAQVVDATTGSTGTPTGSVSFYGGATLLGSSALTNGTAIFSTSSLAAGTSYSFTAAYSGDINFTASSSNAGITVPVTALDFNLMDSGLQSQTVIPGGAISYSFQLSPTFGVYPANVVFTATGLPPGATASFSPATIAANGGAQTVTLTIQTASQTAKQNNPLERGEPLLLGFLLLPLAGMRRLRRHLVFVLFLSVTLVGVMSLSGCGGHNGFNSQAPENYTITVTAASGQLSHSFNVTLNVQ